MPQGIHIEPSQAIQYTYLEVYMFQVHLYIRELDIYRSTRSNFIRLTTWESYRDSESCLYQPDVWLCLAQGAVISARVEHWYEHRIWPEI